MGKTIKLFRKINPVKAKRCLLVFLIFIFSLLSFSYSNAATLSDLQKQQAEINKNIADKNAQISDVNKDIKQTTQDINSINSDIDEIQAKINEVQGQIDEVQEQIAQKEAEIAQKNNELNTELENQKEAIRVMYESGYQDELFILIGSNSLSDVINQSDYLESLEGRIESTIDKINTLKAELEKEKAELEDKNKELSSLQEQQQAYKYGLDTQKAEKNRLLANSESQKKTLEDQIAEAKKLSSQVEAQINSIAASMNKSSGGVQATDRGTSSVGFQWPMNYKYISCYYGESSPFQSFHSGIDLVNVAGTPIYAAADGTVTVAADMMSGGSYYGYTRSPIFTPLTFCLSK